VFGIGGGGGNAVNTMIRANLEGVEFITANTDIQALRFSLAQQNIQIGKELTKGLGAGADPDVGRDAALEDRRDIEGVLKDADMVFITAGMGGGTGTGGAAVIAQIARELGALTVAVVTKPFHFEGKRRRKHAELGIARLRESVDTLITIPNQRLLQIATPDLSMIDAFKMADNVLVNAVRGISDIINIPGTVNVDFADVKTVMSNMGHSLMGIGHAAGPNRAAEAARMAISSPLLEDIDIQGATGILINITAGSSITLMEVNEACSIIQDSAHEDANIIFGAVIDESLNEAIRVTVIATGFPVDSRELDNSGPAIVRPVPARIFSPDYATGGLNTGSSSVNASNHSHSAAPAAATNPVTPPVLEAISEAHELAKWTIQQVEIETNPTHAAPTESTESFADYSCNEESVADDSEESEEIADTYVWEEMTT
ncbi:MAG: cell division protein FtsZ, partial [Proteobacteria bacterium]|nr:cell division protein FtsZ [Pseudomonadota bacterium]